MDPHAGLTPHGLPHPRFCSMMNSHNPQHFRRTSVVFYLKLFLRILVNYVVIGLLMAIPSYRLGLKPGLAATVFAIVMIFGIHHSTVAYLAARPPSKTRRRPTAGD